MDLVVTTDETGGLSPVELDSPDSAAGARELLKEPSEL